MPSIKECGNWVSTFTNATPWTGYWTYSHSHLGYTPVTNLTTRVVQCGYARPFSLRVTRNRARRWQGFRCRWQFFYGEDWDVRCIKGSQVIHWQGGA